ncbi:hypothetical protein NM688_g6336 [Phlebia brevispora]|uniref:Uncharacterized protein n=1 Tax=Phlebia brevispora TaxID=194682 RepID=A0ACC1SH30_9APHY|nr:hypothetical protein NM688_g6336 [Phlebia brevispora]
METRRSSRLAAQPKKEDAPKPAKVPRKPSTKRKGAEGDATAADSKEPAAKKSKASEEKSAEEGDEATADVVAIDIGDSLPTLTLKNEKGEDVEVAELAKEKGVILFLVPKADTPGCTTQACGFRDIYPDFTSSGYDVYCLSADTPNAQHKWQTKKELPYPLISDPKRTLISALGAGEGGKTKRSHFIFEKGGKLVDKKIPVKPADSPKLALEFIKQHSAEAA